MTTYVVFHRLPDFARAIWRELGTVEAPSPKAAVEKLAEGPGEYWAVRPLELGARRFVVDEPRRWHVRRANPPGEKQA